MAQSFVATSSPNGWQLGQWTKKSDTVWEEVKRNDPSTCFKFMVIPGQQGATVPLQMVDSNGKRTGTEALIGDSSIQIFVDGQYAGSYGGEMKAGSKQGGGRTAAPVSQQVAAPLATTQSAEVTMRPPAQASGGQQQISASAPAPPARAAPAAAASRKAANLDTSPQSIDQLVQACRSGDNATVTRLLAVPVDPDGKTRDGTTPLLAAVGTGNLAVVKALLAAGADANLGKDGNNPMTVAFQKGHQDILKALFGAAFQSLETIVGPGATLSPPATVRAAAAGEDEISDAAIEELRETTRKLAAMGGSTRGAGVLYIGGDDIQDIPAGDMDKMREDAVKDAMKLISASHK